MISSRRDVLKQLLAGVFAVGVLKWTAAQNPVFEVKSAFTIQAAWEFQDAMPYTSSYEEIMRQEDLRFMAFYQTIASSGLVVQYVDVVELLGNPHNTEQKLTDRVVRT